MTRTIEGRRERLVLSLALAVALATLGVLWLTSPSGVPSAEPQPSRQDASSIRSSTAEAIDADGGARLGVREDASLGAVILTIDDASDKPVKGACIYKFTSASRDVGNSRKLAATNGDGYASVDGSIDEVFVVAEGYSPCRIEMIEPRRTYVARLAAACTQEFAVKTATGRGIQGVRVTLAARALSGELAASVRSGSALSGDQSGTCSLVGWNGSLPCFSASSDLHGNVGLFGLPRGRYWVLLETAGLPFIRGWGTFPYTVDVPSVRQEIDLSPVIGAVVDFGGNEALACYPDYGPVFRAGIDHADGQRIAALSQSLAQSNPGCAILLGAPPEREPFARLRVRVCWRYGGWEESEVDVGYVHEGLPRAFVKPSVSGVDLAASVLAIAVDDAGGRVSEMDGQGYKLVDSVGRYFRGQIGKPLRVARGRYSLVLPLGLPDGLLGDGSSSLQVDGDLVHTIRLESKWKMYGVDVKVGSKSVDSFGYSYAKGDRIWNSSEPTSLLRVWSSDPTVDVVVHVQGFGSVDRKLYWNDGVVQSAREKRFTIDLRDP